MRTSKILQSLDLTHITSRFLTLKNIGKMSFTDAQKAHIVAKYIRTGSVTVTQRWARTAMNKTPPSRNTILRWHTRFLQDGNMAHQGGNGRPRVSDQNVEDVRLLFENNPRLSIRQAEALLNISRSTIQRILRNCLQLYPYKMQNLHGITNSDKMRRISWARHCQNQPEGMSEYLSKIVFSDECIFRLNGSVNTQNVRIWGTERPIQGRQAFDHSPSIMVWCAISKDKVVGPFYFEDGNVNGENYRNMLIHYAFPRFASLRDDYILHRTVLQHIILIA